MIKKTNKEWTSFAKALGHRELDRLKGIWIKYYLPNQGQGDSFIYRLSPIGEMNYKNDKN